MQQQVLVVDQKAMAMQAMAALIEQINNIQAIIEPPRKDFNRQQMRRFEAKMKPIRLKLARLKVKQAEMQRRLEALVDSNVATA
jgi:hypothetical protein